MSKQVSEGYKITNIPEIKDPHGYLNSQIKLLDSEFDQAQAEALTRQIAGQIRGRQQVAVTCKNIATTLLGELRGSDDLGKAKQIRYRIQQVVERAEDAARLAMEELAAANTSCKKIEAVRKFKCVNTVFPLAEQQCESAVQVVESAYAVAEQADKILDQMTAAAEALHEQDGETVAAAAVSGQDEAELEVTELDVQLAEDLPTAADIPALVPRYYAQAQWRAADRFSQARDYIELVDAADSKTEIDMEKLTQATKDQIQVPLVIVNLTKRVVNQVSGRLQTAQISAAVAQRALRHLDAAAGGEQVEAMRFLVQQAAERAEQAVLLAKHELGAAQDAYAEISEINADPAAVAALELAQDFIGQAEQATLAASSVAVMSDQVIEIMRHVDVAQAAQQAVVEHGAQATDALAVEAAKFQNPDEVLINSFSRATEQQMTAKAALCQGRQALVAIGEIYMQQGSEVLETVKQARAQAEQAVQATAENYRLLEEGVQAAAAPCELAKARLALSDLVQKTKMLSAYSNSVMDEITLDAAARVVAEAEKSFNEAEKASELVYAAIGRAVPADEENEHEKRRVIELVTNGMDAARKALRLTGAGAQCIEARLVARKATADRVIAQGVVDESRGLPDKHSTVLHAKAELMLKQQVARVAQQEFKLAHARLEHMKEGRLKSDELSQLEQLVAQQGDKLTQMQDECPVVPALIGVRLAAVRQDVAAAYAVKTVAKKQQALDAMDQEEDSAAEDSFDIDDVKLQQAEFELKMTKHVAYILSEECEESCAEAVYSYRSQEQDEHQENPQHMAEAQAGVAISQVVYLDTAFRLDDAQVSMVAIRAAAALADEAVKIADIKLDRATYSDHASVAGKDAAVGVLAATRQAVSVVSDCRLAAMTQTVRLAHARLVSGHAAQAVEEQAKTVMSELAPEVIDMLLRQEVSDKETVSEALRQLRQAKEAEKLLHDIRQVTVGLIDDEGMGQAVQQVRDATTVLVKAEAMAEASDMAVDGALKDYQEKRFQYAGLLHTAGDSYEDNKAQQEALELRKDAAFAVSLAVERVIGSIHDQVLQLHETLENEGFAVVKTVRPQLEVCDAAMDVLKRQVQEIRSAGLVLPESTDHAKSSLQAAMEEAKEGLIQVVATHKRQVIKSLADAAAAVAGRREAPAMVEKEDPLLAVLRAEAAEKAAAVEKAEKRFKTRVERIRATVGKRWSGIQEALAESEGHVSGGLQRRLKNFVESWEDAPLTLKQNALHARQAGPIEEIEQIIGKAVGAQQGLLEKTKAAKAAEQQAAQAAAVEAAAEQAAAEAAAAQVAAEHEQQAAVLQENIKTARGCLDQKKGMVVHSQQKIDTLLDDLAEGAGDKLSELEQKLKSERELLDGAPTQIERLCAACNTGSLGDRREAKGRLTKLLLKQFKLEKYVPVTETMLKLVKAISANPAGNIGDCMAALKQAVKASRQAGEAKTVKDVLADCKAQQSGPAAGGGGPASPAGR
jgi:hypothetical protein